jgi:hypothetical protein
MKIAVYFDDKIDTFGRYGIGYLVSGAVGKVVVNTKQISIQERGAVLVATPSFTEEDLGEILKIDGIHKAEIVPP